MTQYLDLIMTVLVVANLLGVGGLYYRLGAAIQNTDHTSKRQDRLHEDHARLHGRVTELERRQQARILQEN